MDFIDIKNIQRKDSPIHYINEYHCDLLYKNNGSEHKVLLEVIVEKTAIGTTNFQINSLETEVSLNSPELESYIQDKYNQGYFV